MMFFSSLTSENLRDRRSVTGAIERCYILYLIQKLTSLHYCVRATKSHIRNSRNQFTRTQSNRTTNWLPLKAYVTWSDLTFSTPAFIFNNCCFISKFNHELKAIMWPNPITWPFDSGLVTSCGWSIVTMRLSCTVTEIWHFKDNGVTILTFWGHVTSSVTWPFDSRWATSYGWSNVTMHLSCKRQNCVSIYMCKCSLLRP